MELLQNRYGKTEFLVNAYTQAILEIEPPANDVHSLRRFHDQLETLLRGLKSLATTDGTSRSMLVAIIKKKLPLEIRTQIYREQSSSELSISQLMAALLKEITAKCGGDLTEDSKVLENLLPTTSSFLIRSNERLRPKARQLSKKPIQCAYCKENHASRLCPTFTDVYKRMEILKREKRCFNCLAPRHNAKQCNSRYTCFNCKGKHHSSICAQRITEAKHAPPPTPTPDAHVALAPTCSPVILKTATAQVQYANRQTSVNILFDEGSQRTFLTEEAAKSLHIDIADCAMESLKIATFGHDQSQQRKYPIVSIQLLTQQRTVPLSAKLSQKFQRR